MGISLSPLQAPSYLPLLIRKRLITCYLPSRSQHHSMLTGFLALLFLRLCWKNLLVQAPIVRKCQTLSKLLRVGLVSLPLVVKPSTLEHLFYLRICFDFGLPGGLIPHLGDSVLVFLAVNVTSLCDPFATLAVASSLHKLALCHVQL